MRINLDFETRSLADLPTVGLDNYANHPSTEVLCMAYSVDGGPVQLWTPEASFPSVFCDPQATFQAWNAMFEYAIWNCVCVPKYCWPPLKLEQVIDSMAIAAANNIPQGLDDAGTFMNSTYKKDPIGAKLIQKLCKPNRNGEFNNDPDLLTKLYAYCVQDVKTEMSIVKDLRKLSADEQKVWELTQRINMRGVPVDQNELQNAVKAVEAAQKEIDDATLALTGCKPSERAKLLAWLNSKGANLEDLTEKTVSAKLAAGNLKPEVKRALELRQEGSQTSVAKYAKMLEVQRNGRIRNTLVYHGASTGRWASRGGLNLQNIARPSISDQQIEDAIPRVFGDGVGSMRELSSLVRSAIKADRREAFVDVDFSSIENRVGVYLAGQADKVELFRKGLDEYKVFASESLYNVPYEEVTKDQRQISKSAVLGAMFGQGAKGLVKYADGMGVKLTEAQAKNAVDNYRESYSKVKNLWALCENAAIQAIQNPGVPFEAGRKLVMKVAKDTLWMQLPSKRLICWQRPEVDMVTTPWGAQKPGVIISSQNTYTRAWGRNQLIGSSIFQSGVQGTARDFLAFAMLSLENAGYSVCNSIHDEVLLIVPEETAEPMLEDVVKIMTTPPSWAPDFPLAAEGWFGKRYRK